MDKELVKYKECMKFLLENDEGLVIQSECDIYIRSLEGEKICVGRVDKVGAFKDEIIYANDFDKAFQHFLNLKVKERLGTMGLKD